MAGAFDSLAAILRRALPGAEPKTLQAKAPLKGTDNENGVPSPIVDASEKANQTLAMGFYVSYPLAILPLKCKEVSKCWPFSCLVRKRGLKPDGIARHWAEIS